MIKRFLFLLLLTLAPVFAFAASPFSVQAIRDIRDGQPAIRVSFDFPADHHLFSSFAVADSQGTPLSPLFVPAPDTNKPDDAEPSYSKPFTAFYASPSSGDSIVVSFQGCAGTLCFMPEDVTLSLSAAPVVPSAEVQAALPVAGNEAGLLLSRGEPRRSSGYQDVPEFLAFLDLSSAPPPVPSAWRLFLKDPGQFYLSHGVLPSILLILLGGFLLNLTPCVLPMIPVNLAIIGASSSSNTSKSARFGLGLVYGLGMALVYGALGLIVVLSGSVFGSLNASPIFNGAIAILFFALSLAMFDVWQLDFSRFRKGSVLTGRARVPAVLVMGGISALLAGACVAPVLIAVLALSGSLYTQGVGIALLLPFLLGIGMALPWPLAAAGLAILPKPGAWMDKVKKIFGVLILLLALYYAWNTLSAFRTPVRAEAAEATSTSISHHIDFGVDSPATFQALLRDAAASGKPVLLDFGAHWCKACHLMDAATLRDPQVVEKLGELFVIQIIADNPNQSPAREILRPLGIQGFPTFLLYPAAP